MNLFSRSQTSCTLMVLLLVLYMTASSSHWLLWMQGGTVTTESLTTSDITGPIHFYGLAISIHVRKQVGIVKGFWLKNKVDILKVLRPSV